MFFLPFNPEQGNLTVSSMLVQRSPDFSLKGSMSGINAYWSHHEKICVVDNKIAFLGGLDLCYG